RKRLMTKVFVDTSYAVALSSHTDENHKRAVELAEEFETSNTHFVTTRAILLEIGNALSKIRHRAAAVRLLTALENDLKLRSWLHRTSYIYELSRCTVIGQTRN